MRPRRTTGARLGDRAFGALLRVLGSSVLVVVGTILFVCWRLARPAFTKLDVFGFITGSNWDPVQESFGAWPFIYGTLVTALVAIAIAAPVSIGIALFVTEMAPAGVRRITTFLVEILAAIPSVVYGLWGLMVLIPILQTKVEPFLGGVLGFLPLFKGPPMGFGYLAAGLLLSIMILPTITSVIIEVMRTMPALLREGALALGATRWEAIRMVILPYARRGILGGVILGLARALGETMAVTMVIGNQPEVHASLFAAGYTLPAVIANEFSEATSDVHVGALAGLALVLFAVTFTLSAGARLLVRMSQKPLGARS